MPFLLSIVQALNTIPVFIIYIRFIYMIERYPILTMTVEIYNKLNTWTKCTQIYVRLFHLHK